jgi:hypothetical protein
MTTLLCLAAAALQVGLWKRCMLVMLEIMDTLGANTNIVLDDTAEPSEERTAGEALAKLDDMAGEQPVSHAVL